ncbi:MAG: hypothetical protein ACLUVF_03905 [Adlercreutzia sp.]
MLQSSNQSNAYYSWLEEQRNAADVQINDMPEGLPTGSIWRTIPGGKLRGQHGRDGG